MTSKEDATGDLLQSVRESAEFIGIPKEHKRGAEAYLQAYAYIADANSDLSKRRQRSMAMQYLNMTATPPLTRGQKAAARKAKRLLEDL